MSMPDLTNYVGVCPVCQGIKNVNQVCKCCNDKGVIVGAEIEPIVFESTSLPGE